MSKYLNKEGLQRLWEHITSELGGKVDKVSGKGLSTNDYTNEDKTKLTGIDEGANKTVVDTELLSGSSNPVQNKVVTARINTIQTAITSINNNKATDFTDNDDIHYPTVKAVSDKVAKDITDSTADWNENDEDATDYIKNRTHYSSNTGSNILEVQSLSLPAALYSIETSGFEYYQYATTTTTEVPYTLSVLQSASYFTLNYNISSGSTMKDTAYLIECRVTDSTGSTASAVGLIFAQAGLSICFNTSGNTVHFMSHTSQTFNHFQLIAQNTKVLKKIDNGYINNLSLEIPKLQTARYLDGLNFDGSSNIYHTMISTTSADTDTKKVSANIPMPETVRAILVLYLVRGNSVTDGISISAVGSDSTVPIYYNSQLLTGDIAKFEAHTALPLVYYNNHWNVVGVLPTAQSSSEITIDDGSID